MSIYYDLDSGLEITNVGGIKVKVDNEVLVQSVRTILSTVPGERLMMPLFGSNLKYVLFDPMDEITENVIATEIADAINNWEDRITVTGVEVESLYDLNVYSVTVKYVINTTGIYSEFSLGLKAK